MKPLLCLLLAMTMAGCATIRPDSNIIIDRITLSDGTKWVLYQGDWVYQMEGK